MKKHTAFIRTEWLILGIIVAIAVVVRFWNLQGLPAALNRDEAALGYNAWMLQTIGRDEWGVRWPLALKSFGDYKLPGYPLAVIGSFTLFGRSDWSVRFPSALAGAVLPLGIWFMALQLRWTRPARLLAAAIIAVAPFSIFYSRMAFEANVALTAMVWSLGVLFKAIRQKSWTLIVLSLLIWLVAIFTYNTPLLLSPFLMLGVLLWFGKANKTHAIAAAVGLAAVFVLATMSLWQLNRQKAGISIFTDPTIETKIIEKYTSSSGLQKLLSGKYPTYLLLLWQHFYASWTPHFLVTAGGSHPWHTVPGTGHLTWFVYLFGIIGVTYTTGKIFKILMLKKRLSTSQSGEGLLLWLLLAGLAPSVITVDSPHATRSLIFMLLLCVFSVVGIRKVVRLISNHLPKISPYLVYIIVVLLALTPSSIYLYQYFYQYPTQQAIFQPGLVEALAKLPVNKPVIVANDGYTYILLAWYVPIKPQDFLETITRNKPDTIGFESGKTIDRFTIRPDFKTPEATNSALLEWTGSLWTLQTP